MSSKPDRQAQLSILDSLLSDEALDELVEMMQVATPETYLVPDPISPDAEEEEKESYARDLLAHVSGVAAGNRVALLSEMKANRRTWAERFGLGALSSSREVDQREVDYRRGFYGGARYYLELLPAQARQRMTESQRSEDA
jgi:hypothetical protein